MKQWSVQVTWLNDGRKVLDASSTSDLVDVRNAVEFGEIVMQALPQINDMGIDCLHQHGDDYDSRITAITIRNGSSSRSIRIEQPLGMSDREADECANRVTAWLFSDETTEILTA